MVSEIKPNYLTNEFVQGTVENLEEYLLNLVCQHK